MEVKLITWNVLNGRDENDRNDWANRKKAFKAALEREKPDIFCTQEALPDQLKHFGSVLKDYTRSGVGRDDGKEAGEYCAIYFDAKRFKKLDEGTFWLSDTPDVPGKGFDPAYARICSWTQLQEMKTEKTFFVFNTHFPLNPNGRDKAAALIVAKTAAIAGKSPAILCGDFNCGADSLPWKAFADAKWLHTAIEAKRKPDAATFHKFGLRLACLDAVFATKDFSCKEDRILTKAEEKILPSDHYGIAVKLKLKSE